MSDLNFALGTIEEAIDADKVFGNYIKEFGAYIGVIKAATIMEGKTPSKSKGLKIEIETDEGMVQDVFWFVGKTGKSVQFALNKIQTSLMPCARLRTLDAVVGAKTTTYPALVGRKVGVLVNIELSMYKDNEQSKTLIDRFFDAETLKTGSEVLGKTAAVKKVEVESKLRIIDKRGDVAPKTGGAQGGDLFNDGAPVDDPFAVDPNAQEALPDTSVADAEAAAKVLADAKAVSDAKAVTDAAAKATADAAALVAAAALLEADKAAVTEPLADATTPAPEDSDDFWNKPA